MSLKAPGPDFRLSDAEVCSIESGEWLDRVTPFDFDLRFGIGSSRFGKKEVEDVLFNVLNLLRLNQDGWGPFSWAEYVAFTSSNDDMAMTLDNSILVTELDGTSPCTLEIFQNLAASGCLVETRDPEGNRWYQVTDLLVERLQKFIGTPERLAAAAEKRRERALRVLNESTNAGKLLLDLPSEMPENLTFEALATSINAHSDNGFMLEEDTRHGRTWAHFTDPGGSGGLIPCGDSPDAAARAGYQDLRDRLIWRVSRATTLFGS